MLEIDHINVKYGDVQVIYDLSLTVGKGEIVTLLGSNGAGKTTVVNTVSGVLRPAGGEIRYMGQSISRVPPHKLVGQGLVQVPEGRMLFPEMSVRENLKMGTYPHQTRAEFSNQYERVLELFPRLLERQTQLVSTMSGGEQQMVAIGRGLMADPKLLVLDEPSVGLAPLLVHEMFRVIKEVNKMGVSILLIEQNAISALRTAHRGYVLENGHVSHQGPSKELLEDESIKSAYLGL